MAKEKEWKICQLKFANITLNVATDGDTIRIRKAGMIPVECRLVPQGKHPQYVDMVEDAIFKMSGITNA